MPCLPNMQLIFHPGVDLPGGCGYPLPMTKKSTNMVHLFGWAVFSLLFSVQRDMTPSPYFPEACITRINQYWVEKEVKVKWLMSHKKTVNNLTL